MVSFSGVGSGIDFGSITSQLVRLERLPITGLESRKSGANRQISLLGDFATKLKALSTAAEDLSTPARIRAVKASSSDEARVKVTATGEAQLGNFDISVSHLARAETRQSRTFATDTAGVLGSGSLELSVGAGEAITVDFDTNDNLSSLARRINDAGAGVRASVLYNGTNYRLLISGDETGAANTLNIDETSDVLGFGDAGSTLAGARDAEFTLSGVPVTRSSNTLSDVVSGVTFELVSATPSGGAATQVKIDRDPEGLEKKLNAFVDALNAVQTFVSAQLSSKTLSPTESLRGDGTLQGFQRQLSAVLSAAHGHDEESLGRYGIKMETAGTFTLKSSKLREATAGSTDGLVRMLAGTGGNGLAAALESLTGEYTRSGDGILASKQTGIRSRITELDRQIERIDDKATSLEDRLRKQFTAADTTIALLNSQTTYISAMLYRSSNS